MCDIHMAGWHATSAFIEWSKTSSCFGRTSKYMYLFESSLLHE